MTNAMTNDIENRGHQLEVSMARFIRTPKMNKDVSISDVIDTDDLKEIMDPFYEMSGLGVSLFDNNNELITSSGWQKICSNFHQKHPESHKSCIESGNYFKKNFQPNTAISYKCSNGLWDIAYPLYIDDDFLGSIYFGQFFFDDEEIDKDFFVHQAEKFSFDKDAYIGILKEVPILNREKINAYIKLFVSIIEKIAKVGKL